jgi:hypothetical protein
MFSIRSASQLTLFPGRQWDRAFGVMSLQALVIAANFSGGLFLARGLAPNDRGAVAITSITLGLSTIFGGAGLSELSLVHAYVPKIKSRVMWVAFGWATVISILAITLLLVLGATTPLGAGAIGIAVLCSVANLHLISRTQLSRGIKWVVRARCGHAVISAVFIACLGVAADLSKTNVYAVWAIAECSLAIALSILLVRSETWESSPPPAGIVVNSFGYALAQTSGMFVDRAIIVIAAWLGGFGSAGSVTVFQNITAPISMPVQTFATAILTGRADGKRERASTVWSVLALSGAAAILGAICLPFLVVPLWGTHYAFIGQYSIVVCFSGFLLSTWRIQQLQLRAAKRPNQVLISDFVALGAASIFASSFGLEKGLNICLLGLVFAMTGCLVSVVLQNRAKRIDMETVMSPCG